MSARDWSKRTGGRLRLARSVSLSSKRCSMVSGPPTKHARPKATCSPRSETLRVIEQTVLLDAATVYMDVVRDAAILEVQRSNVRVLGEILQQTRARFKLHEVTRTDVAQAEAQLAAGQSQMLSADSNLTTSKAAYHRVIGSEPGRLEPGLPVDRLSPNTVAAATDAGMTANPSVIAASYGVDVAQLQVKIAESALYPTVTLLGNAEYLHDVPFTGLIPEQSSATGLITVTVPLYQGGAEYSAIRQSKETLAQRRLDLATTRDTARANVVQVWGEIQAAKAQLQAAQEQVRAAEVALNGVRVEARLGLRTTLDVLIDQQASVNAQVSLVTAQHDRVVGYHHGMMGPGMMAGGMMGHGYGHHEWYRGRGVMEPMMARIIFSLMDADGDGKLTLQEFQAAHERIFRALHADHGRHRYPGGNADFHARALAGQLRRSSLTSRWSTASSRLRDEPSVVRRLHALQSDRALTIRVGLDDDPARRRVRMSRVRLRVARLAAVGVTAATVDELLHITELQSKKPGLKDVLR